MPIRAAWTTLNEDEQREQAFHRVVREAIDAGVQVEVLDNLIGAGGAGGL